ncbi:hypothetical protein [Janthinobacterium fluminis]|uniref:Uncharacterized protein n=1 Tax=Janthinobacterium fluminis TaxID=2987524 RepID=A0ABT5JV98_9BURK|nr:hypothetical protein [Janthinobacterium fluminis]MDC8756662.1 hypothetical protein [Janthinobacterium fluminis]
MLIFLDTEFTTLARSNPDLISIGIAAVGVSDFYAERIDYRHDDTSEFVRAEVIPLLGKIPRAACTSIELVSRLRGWFDALPEPAAILYDYLIDWQLLLIAFAGDLPPNVGTHQLVDHKIFRHSAYRLGEVLVYSAAWPPHHALPDAQGRLLEVASGHVRPTMEYPGKISPEK